MRRLIITFLYLFLLSALVIPSASASDDTQSDYIVTLSDDVDDIDDDISNRSENDRPKRRDSIWSTTCHITPDRIDISSINKESIVSYELYDQHDQCIGSFFDESDFLSAVFTIKGKLKIRIVLDSFSLSGYLEVL